MCFVKGLANSPLTYVPNMIHICPNRGDPSLEVVIGILSFLAIVYPVYIIPHKVSPHLSVYHIYTTEDPEKVRRALGGG